MKKLFNKTVIMIIIGIFAIALPVEILAIIHNQKIVEEEAQSNLEYSVESSGAKLNMIFNSMDNLINMMQAIAYSKFSGEEYRNNYEQYLESKQECSEIMENTLENTDYLSGLYITFNPEIYKNRQEIWYMYDENGGIEFIDSSPEEITPVWLPDDSDYEPDYYYDAVSDGDFWSGMDFDNTLGIYMLTHTRPAYDVNGELIGIVGADIYMDDIAELVESMQVDKNGSVALFSSEMELYASTTDDKKPNAYFEQLAQMITKDKRKEGAFIYEGNKGVDYAAAYMTLDNGWIFASSQPVNGVVTEASDIRDALIVAIILTITLIMGFVFMMVRRYHREIATRAEQNEIIVINQARQAKLGEMIGNISHQCKQPLNSMSIDIQNMTDDFNYNELNSENFNYYTNKMKETIRGMSETIGDFAEFLKPDKKKTEFSLRNSIEKALAMLNESLRINKIDIVNDIDDTFMIKGYFNEFIQCIFNIIENARDAVIAGDSRKKYIKIWAERCCRGEKSIIKINIFNIGEQISEETGSKIFEAYFSTKGETRGTGLGLYLTKQIIEDHFNGEIYFLNTEKGVTFIIELPEEDDGKMGRD